MTDSTQIRVSIVVPAYNAERTLRTMIDSVFDQTYRDYELVICDDASTDSTASIIRSYPSDRIRLLGNQHNLGPGPSRDHAIGEARGKWIALIDADDAWKPDRLRQLVAAAEKYPDSLIFDELLECHDTPSGMVPWRRVRSFDAFGDAHNKQPQSVSFASFIRAKRTIIQPLIPSDLIRKHGINHGSAKYGEDLSFILKLMAHGAKLIYIPEAMYLYRITPGSASSHLDKYQLLLTALKDAMPMFAHDERALSALREKMEDVDYNAHCHVFFEALKSARLHDAFRSLRQDPRVLAGVAKRAWERIPYHFDRLISRGSVR